MKLSFTTLCHYAKCRCAECRYAECRYTECHGTLGSSNYDQTVRSLLRTPWPAKPAGTMF